MIISLNRDDCLKLAETLDNKTNEYLVDDCIATWDKKELWEFNPIAYVVDKSIISVMFANTETYNDEKILYVQRVFTIPEYRKKGHFRDMFNEVYTKAFDTGTRYLKLFIDNDASAAYRSMKFNLTEKTKDGKYYVVLIPMIHKTLEYNNFLATLSPKRWLMTTNMNQYYIELQRKYDTISL
jgi:GNAT superfamily N-acetyltransferase